MCGLIYCADPEIWSALVTANLARAGRNKGAFTVTAVLPNKFNGAVTVGPTVEQWSDTILPSTEITAPVIAHLQAPTSAYSLPHPAVAGEVRVWHNGIIKPAGMMVLQEELYSFEKWDTKLIAQALEAGLGSEPFQSLGVIEGSLACVAVDNSCGMSTVYTFRNAIAPLYTDGRNLSSVPVGAISKPLDPGVVYTLNCAEWKPTRHSFPCTHNPYGL